MVVSPLVRSLRALSDEAATASAAESPWPGDSYSAILGSPSFSTFVEAASTHTELARLMAGATLNVTHQLGGYSTSMPDGAWLVARLLDDGKRLARFQRRTSRDAVHEGIGQALNGFLDALSSGRCPSTAYVGLRGISLDGVDAADVGLGVVRTLKADETRAFAAADDPWPPTDDELCLVLEGEASWSVSEKPPRTAASGKATPISKPELLSVLLLLAGMRNNCGHLRAPHLVWNRPTPYFFKGGGSGGGFNPDLHWRTSSTFDGIVTSSIATEARRLFPSLSQAPAETLHVAARRLVSAGLVYNHAGEDRLVDAAVAWESLFGSQDRDQLALQLALSMAWLLAADDHGARERIFRRAKQIYALRSKLVHGGTAKKQDVEAAANELTEWLRQALVSLLTTHSSLLGASDRVPRLLLQDPANVNAYGI